MILQLNLSRQGTGRIENRDVSGSAHNAGTHLYVIADGTSKPNSGELASALSHHLLECFRHAHPVVVSCPEHALMLVLTSLDEVHSNICPDFPLASTSYLVLLVVGHTASSIHAGDCCLGHLEKSQRLNWVNSPHCGPNWRGDLSHSLIANSPARKTLDTTWIMATDGFWAELSAEDQFKAIVERTLDGCATEDDVTFMLLRT